MAALLSVRNVTKTYRTGTRAVDGVSMEVEPGMTLGIVGESGSGKTTTAKMMLHLEQPDSGTVTFDGVDIFTLGRKDLHHLRRRLQVVPQNPQTSLNPRLTVRESIEFVMRAHGYAAKTRGRKVQDLLHRVGLTAEHADRYPHQMSGGQLQRVAIARALSIDPELIILDEAVSALDKSVQAQVLNLLSTLQADLGLTYVFISHDLAVIEHISDQVAVMYQGRVVEHGAALDVWRDPQQDYTKRLLASIPGHRNRSAAAVEHR